MNTSVEAGQACCGGPSNCSSRHPRTGCVPIMSSTCWSTLSSQRSDSGSSPGRPGSRETVLADAVAAVVAGSPRLRRHGATSMERRCALSGSAVYRDPRAHGKADVPRGLRIDDERVGIALPPSTRPNPTSQGSIQRAVLPRRHRAAATAAESLIASGAPRPKKPHEPCTRVMMPKPTRGGPSAGYYRSAGRLRAWR